MNSTWPQVILFLLVAIISLTDAILVGGQFPPKGKNKQFQQIHEMLQQRLKEELTKNHQNIMDRAQSLRKVK